MKSPASKPIGTAPDRTSCSVNVLACPSGKSYPMLIPIANAYGLGPAGGAAPPAPAADRGPPGTPLRAAASTGASPFGGAGCDPGATCTGSGGTSLVGALAAAGRSFADSGGY